MLYYNKIQKFLHDFVFGSKFINKSSFEIEKIFFLKKLDIKNNYHVFISSLPRSGTTSILNFIYSSKQYASLTYKNMPFLLAPNFSKLFNKKNISKKERAHQDGIFYDIDSPEAFDEVFFNNDKKFIENELLDYLRLILSPENKLKYLSKNNLNYKRIDLISKILPNSIFLIPIRNPLQQSYSLLNQHLHFTKLQIEDDFVRRYMNYIGHNEFGLNHKFWHKPLKYKDCNDINYWLEQWTLFYTNIYNSYETYTNCYFIFYENLTNVDYINDLIKKIDLNNIEKVDFNYFKNSNKKELNVEFDKNCYENAINLYNKIHSRKN